ncbi:hypothetical protein BH11PLA2_BH11PLA2_37070 [soil metagenome]
MPLEPWTIPLRVQNVHGLGDAAILERPCLGLICSVKCPGSVVIKTFDAIRELRDVGVVVTGGFHSPMEKECLEFLLRGQQPVIVVMAKGFGRFRLPDDWQVALDAKRLLILSPFGDEVTRVTKANAQTRNEFVATLAAPVLIPHATPGGQAEAIARTVVECSKAILTFDDEANQNLLQLGARPFDAGTFALHRTAAASDGMDARTTNSWK